MKTKALVKLVLVFSCALSFAVFAEVPIPSDADVLSAILKFIGGISGASSLGIALGLVQTLAVVFSSQWGNLLGKWKLVAVSLISVLVPLLGALVAGTPILSAVLSGAVLAALQVFVNEVIKHFKEPAQVSK